MHSFKAALIAFLVTSWLNWPRHCMHSLFHALIWNDKGYSARRCLCACNRRPSTGPFPRSFDSRLPLKWSWSAHLKRLPFDKFPYSRLRVFRRGKKFQGFISFGHHHTHRWLTDCSQPRTNRRRGRVTHHIRSSLHTTALSFHLWHVKKKNCAYRRNGITIFFFVVLKPWLFQTTVNRLSSHAYLSLFMGVWCTEAYACMRGRGAIFE